MHKAKTTTLWLTIRVSAVVTGLFLLSVPVHAVAMQDHGTHPMNANLDRVTLEKVNSHHLPALAGLLEKAVEAVKAGDKEAALKHLQKAQAMLDTVKQAVAIETAPKFANTQCPMMGGKIDPEKVTDVLTREFNGQTVAFCCGGCPAMWDKLSNAEKEARLAAVKPDAAVHQHGQ